MQAEIITIGDELLIGQVVDTNSAHIAAELDKIGLSVDRITSIHDTKSAIEQALDNARKQAAVVLLTGGLGPTRDDITKQTFCDYFGDTLVRHEATRENVYKLFREHLGQEPNTLNLQQANLPTRATILPNRYGTAPGMWMEEGGTVFVSLPGVPYEMKALLRDEVLPRLQKRFDRPAIVHKTLLTVGVGESVIAEKIADWENALPAHIKLAYLPSLGRVRLRLSATGQGEAGLHKSIDEQLETLRQYIDDIIVGEAGEQTLEEVVADLLRESDQTLSVAESCTGGNLAKQITARPGASAYFRGGAVTYATDTKSSLLGVTETLLREHRVVSAAVACAMAEGAKRVFQSDFALSTTGIAGPQNDFPDKEIGTVFIGIATPHRIFAKEFQFGKDRKRTIHRATEAAFGMLWEELAPPPIAIGVGMTEF